MPSKGSEKPILKDLVIALASQLGGQWTDTNISRWVGQRRGVFSAEMNNTVTHLICSPDEFKKRGPRVKQALKRGAKSCDIVTIDWLEDSINKKRKLPVKPYLLSATLKQERAKKRREEKEVKGLEQAERFVNPNKDLHHIYTDETYFRYEVTLTRDEEAGGVKGQRYVLYLFESNARPHLYLFAAKFYKKYRDSQPNFYRPSETPQSFNCEFNKFKIFFQKKTGIEWDERLIRARTADNTLFSYKRPTGGKPVGYVPEGLLPPDSVELEARIEDVGSLADVSIANKTSIKGESTGSSTATMPLDENRPDQATAVAGPHGGGLIEEGLSPEAARQSVAMDVEPTVSVPADRVQGKSDTNKTNAALDNAIGGSTPTAA